MLLGRIKEWVLGVYFQTGFTHSFCILLIDFHSIANSFKITAYCLS